MKSIFSGAGYLMNDDRAAGGTKTEADILTCAHCQRLLIVASWKEDGGWCGRCGAPSCGTCADRMLVEGCTPFVKRVEERIKQKERERALVRG